MSQDSSDKESINQDSSIIGYKRRVGKYLQCIKKRETNVSSILIIEYRQLNILSRELPEGIGKWIMYNELTNQQTEKAVLQKYVKGRSRVGVKEANLVGW